METLLLTTPSQRRSFTSRHLILPNELVPEAFFDTFSALLSSGERERALELFYTDVIGMDPTPMRSLPIWQARLAAVHTLEREGWIGLDYRCDPERYASITVPVRLLPGIESPQAFRAAAKAAAAAIPGSDLVELPGQGHAMTTPTHTASSKSSSTFSSHKESQPVEQPLGPEPESGWSTGGGRLMVA